MASTETARRGEQPAGWHALTPETALERLSSSAEGLAENDARERLARHGPNVLERSRGPGALEVLGRQINNPIVYLLLGSAALAIALGKILDGCVVLGAVVVNALIGFLQEYRAGKAIEAISRMVPQEAQVVRGGRTHTIPSTALVPGDVVLLSSGDRVPADIRLLTARNFQVEEAALTGESVPAHKAVAAVDADSAVGDRRSMAFGGTLVTSGTSRGVVVATGSSTELGRISHLLQQTTDIQTPLTRALATVGKSLTVAVLVISVVLVAVSLLRGYSVADAVLVGITLAVACIPEGLPAIITIALAVGVQRMASRNAVIRKLPSVETLGSTTVICTDKTGTLTRNEMTVQALATRRERYRVSGVGYAPRGDLVTTDGAPARPNEDVRALLEAAALCSDASVHADGEGGWRLSGDPTEGALVVAAQKLGLDVDGLRGGWPRLDVIPFESEHQFMATLHAAPGGEARWVFVKGAPEAVVRRCALSVEEARDVMASVAAMAAEGMRVLAVARKRAGVTAVGLQFADVESGLELLGLEGMIDPPRPEAIDAIRTCHAAGITVKMITGDHVGTAEAIGAQLGLVRRGERGITGAELARFDAGELRRNALRTHVFARVAPEHKLRLVKALQEDAHVVAMTGDGVNDAPALKQANIGVAMGITGTAASKEAADVVLADDNFATIAAAVEEGRRIYDNLIKSLAFVLPTNLGLGLILVAAVAFFPVLSIAGQHVPLMPVLPTQLLWVNLVASVALSLPLAFEVKEVDAMARPPRDPRTPILSHALIVRTLTVAVLMAAGGVGLFLWEYGADAPQRGHAVALREAQTMAVTTVVFFQIFYLFSCRSLRGSARELGFLSNRFVFLGIGLLLLLQAAFIYVPFLQAVFGTAALSMDAVARSALVGAIVLPAVALDKRLHKRAAGRRARAEASLARPRRASA